jgi:hypothetical protein
MTDANAIDEARVRAFRDDYPDIGRSCAAT